MFKMRLSLEQFMTQFWRTADWWDSLPAWSFLYWHSVVTMCCFFNKY